MQASCAQILGLVLLVNTNLAIVIAFATPYWIEYRFLSQIIKDLVSNEELTQNNHGLWAHCNGHDCEWVFDRDFAIQKHLPDWFKATQGLMAAGLGLGLIALLFATLSLCCDCHGCNQNPPICVLLIIGCLCMGIGVLIFGIKAKDEWNVTLENESFSSGKFGWSFWVAVGASALALLTSVVYGCMGSRHN